MISNIIPDCGNAPKKILIKDFSILIAQGKVEGLSEFITEDIRWELVGEKLIKGQAAFIEAIKDMGTMKIEELTIHEILTQGNEGASHGQIRLSDGAIYGYGEFYAFWGEKGTRIRSMTTYVTKIA